jgi:hypothetical protein
MARASRSTKKQQAEIDVGRGVVLTELARTFNSVGFRLISRIFVSEIKRLNAAALDPEKTRGMGVSEAGLEREKLMSFAAGAKSWSVFVDELIWAVNNQQVTDEMLSMLKEELGTNE